MQVTLGQSRAIPCPHQLGSKPRANGDECKAIGFIIPTGPENRGSSKVWSLSWTSVFLPVGAGVFVLTVLNSKSQQLLTISQLSIGHYVKKARLGKSRQVNFLDLMQFLGCDYNSVIVSAFLQSKWFSSTAFWCPVSGFLWPRVELLQMLGCEPIFVCDRCISEVHHLKLNALASVFQLTGTACQRSSDLLVSIPVIFAVRIIGLALEKESMNCEWHREGEGYALLTV
ncbi:hypothetical protein EK904_009680 [Melospiza melodia maxima]|nr:hypothetical protein EK904_009680 [Melospiza melodia maxima]